MTAKQVMAELLDAGAQVWSEDGRLCYRAPANGLDPALRARLIEHKSALLPLLREHEKYALPSFAQQRLWLTDQIEPGNPAYNVLAAMRLSGLLDERALERSLSEIGRRHEALRTRFTVLDGQPLQVIDRAATLAPRLADLTELAAAEREGELERLIAAEARQPFDLAVGPLLRFTLARLAADEHVLLLVAHHSVCDGWSMGVLTRELATLYPALAAGQPVELAPLPLQYADYAAWQRQWLAGDELERQLAYWREQLGGELPVLELPTDRPRPPVQSYAGARESLTLEPALIAALEELSQREGATLYMTLLAAFQALLHRYCGQDQVVVGTPIANRSRPEFEPLVGCFVNTLVLRTDLSGEPSFRELLGRVRAVALGAYDHQDVPFERLVQELAPARDLSRSPLFQVLFVLQNTPSATLELPGLALQPLPVETGTAKFDLSLSIEPGPVGLVAGLEYSADLFDAATARRILGHFAVVLAAIAADPTGPVSRLPLLTATERRLIVEEWNATRVDRPDDVCLHELIEAQVARTPEAVAVAFEQQTLTYRELNRRANQLAHHLRRLGVGPEVLVGICMERSLEMVVGLLGILKAGGAYVPLDPSYPPDRLQFMLGDARVPVLLSQPRLAATLPAHQAQVVLLDPEWATIATERGDDPDRVATAENLAYVIYTSGSTGQPKGAMNTHRGICNRLLWMQDAYGLTESDRVLQKTPFTFDVSVWEFFWPLLVGARLVVARPGGHQDGAYLVELIAGQAITTLHFVPSMLQVFLEEPRIETCRDLRRVICSGEALPYELQERFFDRLGAELHNLYGPTEAAVDVTFWACQRGDDRRFVPIGRPIANTQIYLLDAHLQPAPIGVAGELHIGGVGVARGYLNRPELTAASFIRDPFSSRPDARLYKTGDLARYGADGAIEYLGRRDFQVKIRGHRIELGEIEAAIGRHPGVRETVVVAGGDSVDDRWLVAYLVVDEPAPSTAELRSSLERTLPGYMIPTDFVVLDALPLTPNGKLDRRALPSSDRPGRAASRAMVAPRDSLEFGLAQVWTEVFKVPAVSITDNFFDLGGHSLLAVRLMALIEERFEQRLPLSTLFQGPTIEHLALVLREQPGSRLWSPLVAIQPNGSRPPLFCVHPTGGDVLCYRHLAHLLGPDQPFYGLQAFGLDGDQEPYTRIPAMAAHYIEALRTVQPEGPYHLSGWSFGGLVAYEMAHQLREQSQEIALLAIIDSPGPVSTISAPGDRKIDQLEWASWFAMIATEFETTFNQPLSLTVEELRQLTPEQQLERFIDRLNSIDFLPAGAGVSIARGFWRVHEGNIRAMWSYVGEAQRSSQPIMLFRATEELAEEDWEREIMASPTLGWGTLTSAPVRVHTLPGNHNQLLSRPQVEVLAATLAAYLQAPPAQAASNGHGSVSYLTGLGVIAPEAVREYVSNPASPGSRGAMAGPGEVRIEGLVKTYQTSHRKGLFKRERRLIEALNGVSLHIQPGEVFGLLGPNGAGKTTLIKCLTTLLAPSQGEAWVNGFRLGAQDNEIRASIGCMLMGDRGLYWKLTGRENLEFFGALYHLNERDRRRRAGEIIERLHLEEIADRAVETYSSGQKMKLAFGKALVNDAPLLILDEPTNTLDLPSANDLRAAVRDMNRAGKTVIYTTHIMSEAEMMCDRVAIIDRGKLLAIGTVPALKASLRRAEVIRVEGVISPLARQAVEKLPGVTGVAMVAVNGHTELKVVAGDRQALLPNLIETLVRHKTVMQRIVPEEPTLEDVFIAHTGRALAEEAGAK